MNVRLFALILAVATATAPAWAQTDADVAIETRDGDGLIDALLQGAPDFTKEQKANARVILLEELAISGPDDIAKRRSIGEALRTIDSEDRVATSLLTGNEGPSGPTAQVLPDRFKDALAAGDGDALTNFILTNGFSVEELGEWSGDIEEVVAAYVRPLPASDAEANKRGYQALALLDPSNTTYTDKALQYATAEVERRNALLRTLEKKTDDFNGITFYKHPTEPHYADTRTYFLPYLAKKDDRVWMRFQAHYTSDSWLFVKSLSFNIDGQVHRFPNADWKRDNDSEIWEWADVSVDKSLEELLLQIANSKKTIARFDGQQYYDNVTVSAGDKQAIKDMITAKGLLEASTPQ